MALPPRVFFTLYETSVRWDCSISDIAGWAAVGKLKIKTGIGLVRCGEAVFAGQVDISAMDLLPLFRRSGTGPVEGVVRRIMPPGHTDWLVITDPAGGVTITVADMLILAEDIFGFEDDHDMVRRAPATTSSTPAAMPGTSSPTTISQSLPSPHANGHRSDERAVGISDNQQFRDFALRLMEKGVDMNPSATLHSLSSIVHTEADIVATARAMAEVLEEMP